MRQARSELVFPSRSQGSTAFAAFVHHYPHNGAQTVTLRSDYNKEVEGQFITIGLKIAKKCSLYLDTFSCAEINVFHSFFALRLEMHVRGDNQYKTGADRGNILGQPRLFLCMGICVLSPAHESEMRGYLVYVLIIKYLSHRFCLNSATVY